MNHKKFSKRLLQWILWLIAIHSTLFGIALITFPAEWIEFFGFTLPEKFFAAQGGVFHIIISLVYIFAALWPESSGKFIFIACFTKFSASIFLLTYILFGKTLWIVFLSGVVDFLMAVAILSGYLYYVKNQRRSDSPS